jgi:hypothetical protein
MMQLRFRVGRVCTAMAISFLIPRLVHAQTPPPFELDLSTPDVPAFTILGVAPTPTERPLTPRALALSLLGAATDDENLIPNKYALVAAPFWMRPNKLTIADYFRPTVRESLAQTFTFSLATTPVSSNTDIGVGLSVSPWAGHGSAAFADALASLQAINARYLAADGLVALLTEIANGKSLDPLGTSPLRPVLQGFIDRPNAEALKDFLQRRYEELFTSVVPDPALKGIVDPDAIAQQKKTALATAKRALGTAVDTLFASDPLPVLSGPVGDLLRHVPEAPTDSKSIQEARSIIAYRVLAQVIPPVALLKSSAETAMKASVAEVHSEDKLRMGWMLGVAGAFASRVPNDAFTGGQQLRWAFWASPAYRNEAVHVEIIGIVKWIQRDVVEGPDLFDFGARVVKQAGRTAVSAEFLGRTERADETAPVTQRLTANVDYKIVDKAFVTVAFGKDFADPSAGKPKGGIVSILGFSIGLSKNPTVGQ